MKQDSRNLLGIWEFGNWRIYREHLKPFGNLGIGELGKLQWTSKTFWEFGNLGIWELKEFTDIDPGGCILGGLHVVGGGSKSRVQTP